MDNITTTDLKDFGERELAALAYLIRAYMINGVPDGFSLRGLTPMFNKSSGLVFFTNDDYEVAIEENGFLILLPSCTECEDEDFI